MSSWNGMRPWVPSKVGTGACPPLAPIILAHCTSYYSYTYIRIKCLKDKFLHHRHSLPSEFRWTQSSSQPDSATACKRRRILCKPRLLALSVCPWKAKRYYPSDWQFVTADLTIYFCLNFRICQGACNMRHQAPSAFCFYWILELHLLARTVSELLTSRWQPRSTICTLASPAVCESTCPQRTTNSYCDMNFGIRRKGSC